MTYGQYETTDEHETRNMKHDTRNTLRLLVFRVSRFAFRVSRRWHAALQPSACMTIVIVAVSTALPARAVEPPPIGQIQPPSAAEMEKLEMEMQRDTRALKGMPPNATVTVAALSQAGQELYLKLAPSLVHIKHDIHADQLAPDSIRQQIRELRGPLMQRRDNAGLHHEPSATQPNGAAPHHEHNGERDAAHDTPHPDEHLDLIGIVIDDAGHVLVHAPLFNDADKKIAVTLPDGSETTATVQGTDVLRGLCIITLANHANCAPLPLTSAAAPNPGELLLSLSINRGAINWVAVSAASIPAAAPAHSIAPLQRDEHPAADTSGHPGEQRRHHERDSDPITFLITTADDRWPTYLFNTNGQLVALSWNRRAFPMAVMAHAIKDIIEHRPRQFGITYSLVGLDSPLRTANTALGQQPAVVVNVVTPGSPAARAGLATGDFILTIDHRPINQLMRILSSMREHPGEVDIEIIRSNTPQTLKLNMERPAKP